jgi:hypothetical protein
MAALGAKWASGDIARITESLLYPEPYEIVQLWYRYGAKRYSKAVRIVLAPAGLVPAEP